MEQTTSWFMAVISNPFAKGLALGILFCVIIYIRGFIRRNELSREVNRLRSHLHTKLEIDSAENERRKSSIDQLKEERDNLRNMIQVLNQKPGRQEIRQAQVYQKAIDIMFEKAPGFAPAWQITLKEAEEQVQQAERGLIPFLKRMTGTPGKAQEEDFETERKKALEMKTSGS